MTYELHPLCTLFPRMQGAEFDALIADIRENGQREPITLYQNMILDGGNRYRACIAAGRMPQFEPFHDGNIVTFVLSKNLHRRHMSAGQQAAIVASAQDWAKTNTRGGDRRSENFKVSDDTLKTVKARAATSGASVPTQLRAEKVAKANPQLAAKVARGETSLGDAVKQVTGKRPGAKAPTPAQPDAQLRAEFKELAEIADDLRRENETLRAQVAAFESTAPDGDLRKQIATLIARVNHAEHEQGITMDRAAKTQDREKWIVKLLRQCAKVVGVKDPAHTDPRDIVKAVQAYAEARA
jgi:ParB-like chromosome segregation protein Spo0J